jgi:phosphoglycolate phosphatase
MLIVFDLDGTLVDSRRDLADAANAMLAHYGAAPLDEVVVGRMVGEGAAVLVGRVLAARGLAVDAAEALQVFLAAYDDRLVVHTRPYEGMQEALEALAPWATLAVLTNKPTRQAVRLLEALGLRRPFGEILGGDGPHPRKPHPAGLEFLMRTAGASPADTVLVGDSRIDLLTAANAGTRACLARYGFGFEGVDATALSGRELLVDAPAELPRRLVPSSVPS